MHSTFTIRPATRDDIDALIELAADTFRETYRLTDDLEEIEEYVATAFTPEVLTALLVDAASTLLVGLEETRFVGYAHVKQSIAPLCVASASPIELVRLYLRQDVIGQGYGAAFMKAITDVAQRARCDTLWLVVYSRNEHARYFYKRWGFADVGIKDFMFGGRAYPDPVMAMPLSKGQSQQFECETIVSPGSPARLVSPIK